MQTAASALAHGVTILPLAFVPKCPAGTVVGAPVVVSGAEVVVSDSDVTGPSDAGMIVVVLEGNTSVVVEEVSDASRALASIAPAVYSRVLRGVQQEGVRR